MSASKLLPYQARINRWLDADRAIHHRNRGNTKALRRARKPILMSPECAAFILRMRKAIVEMLKPLVLAELKHRVGK